MRRTVIKERRIYSELFFTSKFFASPGFQERTVKKRIGFFHVDNHVLLLSQRHEPLKRETSPPFASESESCAHGNTQPESRFQQEPQPGPDGDSLCSPFAALFFFSASTVAAVSSLYTQASRGVVI